jgi:hypothetical protein
MIQAGLFIYKIFSFLAAGLTAVLHKKFSAKLQIYLKYLAAKEVTKFASSCLQNSVAHGKTSRLFVLNGASHGHSLLCDIM